MANPDSSWLAMTWRRLTQPHPTVVDRQRYGRAQVLASISLILASLIAVTLMGYLISGSPPEPAAIVGLAIFLTGYVLSRTRLPEAGAVITVTLLQVLAFGFLILERASITSAAVIFLLAPILLGAFLLPAPGTAAAAVINVVGFVVYSLAAPWVDFQETVPALIATIFVSAVILVSEFVRERDIQLIERQSKEMAAYSTRLQADMRRIEATAEVGRTITGTREVRELLDQVVNLIVGQFDYYHAQVFLIDEAGQNAVLRASTGDVGRQLLARGHRLPVGSQSVIGQVTYRGEPIIASDTDTSLVHRRNELLPNTRSEMALPLKTGGYVIGALDVQSVNPDAFTSTDVSVFQTMADQLAVAIENARLFQQARRDLDDIERLNRQLTGEAWRDYVSRRGQSRPAGFATSPQGIRTLEPGEESQGEAAISVPLTVRGETIGMIDIIPRDKNARPDAETQQMIEAVAERVALALDSRRLSDQAQQQAAREMILSQVSAELQATTDLDVILRVAAREASRALGTPQGFMFLTLADGESAQSEE